ncbi:mevalonate kinase-like [Uloborus diversus]|uniref:mevalonate kinase-like n=1 Tax=Uloborus diversus TaxID=327109 RepID=UPI0024099F40|nr:mevalonate kinase-like [Uloborus diversus]
MKIEITSPGKAILHGEHAVVYGKAAIAVSLNLKTSLLLMSHDEEKVVIELKNLALKKEFDINELNALSCSESVGDILPATDEMFKKISESNELNLFQGETESQKLAITVFLYLWTGISKSYNAGSFTPCNITVDSELSIGSGMGSSASFSVCLSTAALVHCGRITPHLLPEDKQLINKWAYEAEKIFHGKPSGIDNTVCTYGGAVLFENGAVVEMLELYDIPILLVDTKVPRNTKVLVTNVKAKKEKYPQIIVSIMDAIDAISKECWSILKKNSTLEKMEKLQELMIMNHHLLNCIGVGHKDLSKIHDIAEKHCCASKLTGAGGGGCAIILLPLNENFSVDVLKQELSQDFSVWDICLGGSGVEVKFHN